MCVGRGGGGEWWNMWRWVGERNLKYSLIPRPAFFTLLPKKKKEKKVDLVNKEVS